MQRIRTVSTEAVPAGSHGSAHTVATFIDALGSVSQKQVFPTEFCPTFENKLLHCLGMMRCQDFQRKREIKV